MTMSDDMTMFNQMAASLGMSLLVSMALQGIDDVNAMAGTDDDMLYVPAARTYNEVLVPINAAAGSIPLPDEFVAAVGKTEAYLLSFPQREQLMLDYCIAMEGLQALVRMLMPASEGVA